MSCWRIRVAALGFLAAAVFSWPAFAQETMTEIHPLDFGLFSLRDNDAQHTLVVDAGDNSYTADPPFAVATPPQRGEYLLEGFAPGTDVTVDVADGGLTLNGAGGTQVFATISYTVSPATVTTDGAGTATVYVGATLRTRGDAVMYPTGSYSDDIDITFSW